MSVASANVDFDLHGIVGVRVVGATRRESDAVRRQLGPIEGRLRRPPDITVRFTDEVRTAPSRILGNHDVAFSGDAFYLLRGRGHASTEIGIAFDQLGDTVELLCRRGTYGVPHLLQIINLTALARGHLALHASCVEHDGLRVLITGWAKGGKTETLLALMANGARYIGDEWIYLDPVSRVARGIPEPIRLWKWQLDAMPDYRRRVSRASRARLGALGAATGIAHCLRAAGGNSRSGPASLVRRGLPILERQLSVQVPPAVLFGDTIGAMDETSAVDVVILPMTHDHHTVECAPINGWEVASRMGASLAFERVEFLSQYLAFLFAFPDRRNEWLESVPAQENRLLHNALDGLPAFTLLHPLPMNIPELYEALEPALATLRSSV